ncbi:ABC-type bacteriocin/lantibiotic exporter with double-glycine peptidase domain [Rhizobium sp. PP-WC-1G-195]|nr:ABC-type bacteriocin/lantibiotic exporter with double-glycine peptidase domain [Rhizobium sp. PP-WC-1G-195]
MASIPLGWRWVWRSLRMRRGSVALLILSTLASYLALVAVPVIVQSAVDATLSGKDFSLVLGLALALGLFFLIDAQSQYLSEKSIQEIGLFIERRMSRSLLISLFKRPTDYTRDGDGEDLVIFQQVQKIRDFAFRLGPRFVLDIGQVLISAIVLFAYDILIASIVIVVSCAVSFLLRRLLARFEHLETVLLEADIQRQSNLSETVSGLQSITLQSLEWMRLRSFDKVLKEVADAELDLGRMSRGFGRSMNCVSGAITMFVLAIGSYKLSLGKISVGDLFAIQILVNKIVTPVLTSGDIVSKYAEVQTAMRTVAALGYAIGKTDAGQMGAGFNVRQIIVSVLHYEYVSGLPVLKGINLSFPEKGVVAIVGRNGSGKTTLLKAVLGLIHADVGSIRFGGIPLSGIKLRALRRSIGVVEQDTLLFTGLISENIARAPSIDKTRLLASARAAGIENLISDPDRTVKEGGLNLSGGQRQRIAYARAIYSDTDLLVLDEPTSFLDPEAARAFETDILALGQDKLVLLVTHDLRIAAKADTIVVVADGEIAGFGSHDSLLRSCTTYEELQRLFDDVRPQTDR